MNIGNVLLYQPIISGLFVFYRLFGSLGWAIIALTVFIRLALAPLTLPGMKAALKMQELAPQLAKLKKKFGKNREKLAKAQMDLYKQYKINPAAGCLPQIVQIIILITLYRVFNDVLVQTDPAAVIDKVNSTVYSFLRLPETALVSRQFWYLDLSRPDVFRIGNIPLPGAFLLLAEITQYLAAKMTLPAAKKQQEVAKKTPSTTDDFSTAMQKQSLYLFPLMTLFFGFTFPSGLVVYWAVFSLVNLIQQGLMKKNMSKKE